MAKKKDRGGFSTPDVIDPPESMEITICIPKNVDHMKAFWGALWELTMWNSWQPDAAHTGTQLAAVWYRYWLSWDRQMSDIDCEENGMVKCCIEPVIQKRIDPVTGRPQVSYDGGAWTGDPQDPQNAVIRPQPPVTSGVVDSACTAALNAYNGMLSLIADSSSNIATASTAYELATLVAAALLNVFLIVVTGGIASPLVLTITGIVWGVGTAVFELGQAGFDAYWGNTDTLDELKCALVDNIGSDGSFTDAQYEAFRTQFKFNSPSSPARDFVLTSLGVGGSAGLSVMATLGDAEGGDCSDCEEPTGQQIWYVNAMGVVTSVYPDEDGVYSISSGATTLYPDLYYISVWFNENEWLDIPGGAPYANCWRTYDDVFPEGSPIADDFFNCATGGTGTPYCYSGRLTHKTVPWTWQFKVDLGCV